MDFGVAGFSSNLKIDAEAGSLKYMPPEILSGKSKSVGPAIDNWGLGCILFGMICGELPFNGGSTREIIQKICDGDFAIPRELDSKISAEVKDLIKRILVVNPNQRYTINDISSHPWITGMKLKYYSTFKHACTNYKSLESRKRYQKSQKR